MIKTPIAYYGGKQSLLKSILPLIPDHKVYIEAFFGGGTVFFAKAPVKSEVINDTNNMVVNFYEVVQTDFDALKTKIEQTPFSRTTYCGIYDLPNASFILSNSSSVGVFCSDQYGIF